MTEERKCAWCGADISHLRSNAKWCQNGNRCQSRSYRARHLEERREACRAYHRQHLAKHYEDRVCSWCSNVFTPRRKDQKSCCRSCGQKRLYYDKADRVVFDDLDCPRCGVTFTPRMKTQKFCSKSCGRHSLDKQRYSENKDAMNAASRLYHQKNASQIRKRNREKRAERALAILLLPTSQPPEE